MKRKIIAIICIFSVILTLTVPFNTSAQSTAQKQAAKQQELDRLNEEQAANNQQLQTANDNISATTSKLNNTANQISNTEAQIATLTELVAINEQKIAENEASILEAEQNLSDEYDKLLDRLRINYENGTASYYSLVLASKDISELLTRMDSVSQIMNDNKKIMATISERIENIKSIKAQNEQDKAANQSANAALTQRKSELSASRSEYETLKTQYESEKSEADKSIEQTGAEILAAENALNDLSAQLIREAEEARKAAEEAARKKAEAERLAAEKAAEEAKKNNTGDDKKPDPPPPADTIPEATGLYIWPLPSQYKTISSGFGWRTLFGVSKLHAGTDIPAPTGTPIYAVNSGIVTGTGYDYSGGNYIVISHSESITTLYYHCSKIIGVKGQSVTKGDTIALVGNTGAATTGSHLHLACSLNGTLVDAMKTLY